MQTETMAVTGMICGGCPIKLAHTERSRRCRGYSDFAGLRRGGVDELINSKREISCCGVEVIQ